jgi:type II secretory pathway pseudopilin PulG
MRRRDLKSAKLQITNYKSQNPQRGYMLITLTLALALITIALLAVLPEIAQQIKRDRETEMVHRGTAYMRAIQHYYKKFSRYPTKIEDLENTNNIRFIRKRYTDPMNRDPVTGKERDFKFLHQQDISLNTGLMLGQTAGQGLIPGQNGQPGQGPGALGAAQGALAAMQGGLAGMQGGLGGFGTQPGGIQQNGTQNGLNGTSDTLGTASDAEGNSNSPGSPSSNPNSNSSPNTNSSPNSSPRSGFSGQVFGGGPILGVASTNKKDKSIHVYYGKDHYSDWLFVYLPQADRGGLLTGPINPGAPNPNLNGGNLNPGQPGGLAGQSGGLSGQGFGQGQGQGQGFGQGFGSNSGPSQGMGTQPAQNPAPTQQQ